MDIIPYNIRACRFDYEFLGKSVETLAKQYGFSLDALYAEIEHEGWERKIEPTSLPETKDLQKFADELEAITRSKLSIISLFRQIENQPLIAQLEKLFLEKALELGASLDPFDDKSANKLAALVKSIVALQDRNPVDLANQLADAKGNNARVIVNIANKLQ